MHFPFQNFFQIILQYALQIILSCMVVEDISYQYTEKLYIDYV